MALLSLQAPAAASATAGADRDPLLPLCFIEGKFEIYDINPIEVIPF